MNRIWDFSAFRNRTALKDERGAAVRYDELEELQDRLSGEIASGELILMMCRNSVGALSGYAALLNSGHPMLLVSAAIPEDMRGQIMDTYRPGLVFSPRSPGRDFSRLREIRTIGDYVLYRTDYPEPYPVYPELGLMLTTSGSTGSVKFVRQSWENIRFNARSIMDYLALTGEDRTVTALPMDYTYGLSILNANLLAGALMLVTDRSVMDVEFWDLFENERVSSFHGVPGTYAMLRRLELFCEDFPELRLMTQAGGKLDPELQRFFAEYARDHQKRFVIMYGQCEATAAISYLPAEKALEKPGSAGIVIPGGEIELMDAEGNSTHARLLH